MATGTWSFLRFLLGLFLLFGSFGSVHATPATDWLQQQSRSDGAYRSDAPLATDPQSTIEAIAALEARDLGNAPDVGLARDYLAARPAVTTEELARRIRLDASTGTDTSTAVERLLEHQNRDGGFGDRTDYTSTALDTAWALEALTLADSDHLDAIGRGIGFLLNRQKTDGSWSDPGVASAHYTTALTLRALGRLRDRFDLDAAIDAAHAYLLNASDSTGAIGSPHETAAAILALAPTSASKTVYSNVVSSLQSRQDANGSWGSSVFTTALAIQALALAERPQPNPELGSLSLRLLDAETGEFLDGVEISLSGPERRAKSTGSDGQVVFRNMETGEYKITATTTGYSDLETSARIDGSKRTELGDIRLFRSTEEDVAHLTGVVTAVDDGTVIAGAEIHVTGDVTARAITDETGQFTITGLAVGAVRIEASAHGHRDTVIEVSLTAGQTSHVNIPLPSIDDHSFSVSGIITATASAEPIAGATVEVDGAATASTKADQDGKYRLADLPAGSVTITASALNFGEVRVDLEAEPGSEYIFSPTLPESGSTVPEDDIALSGKVVDAIASTPISNASVEINTSEGIWTAVTGSDGVFHVDDLTGADAQIAVSAAGYANGLYSVTLSPGVTLDAGELELVPADNTSVVTVSKQVLDSETGDPIEGARVESIYPGFSDAAFTDASGEFSVDVVKNREGRFLVTADGYESADFSVYFMSANDQTKAGDIYLRPEGLVALQPDLAVGSIDVSQAETDSDMFRYGGSASIDIGNLGGKAVAAPFVVVARDLDGQVLGEATVDVEIPAGGSHTVEVDLNGTVTFRDEPFELILDADSSIPELDEGNNAIDTRERCLDNLAGCPLGKAARVDGWMDVLTPGGHRGSSWWVFHENGRLAELRGNYNPRMLISDFVLEEGVIAGTLETGTTDNDMIGFVWGYQDAQHFYRFRWRKNFPRYMQVHRIDSTKPLFNGVGTDDELLFESVNGWEPNVEYTYFLDFKPGNTRITVFEGDDLVESIKIEDSKYKMGQFGIYNHSQPGSFYRVYPDQDSLGVDLTVGALQVVDRGIGNLPALRARVGNAGAEASPGDVKVQFYSGDPDADGQLLATSNQSTIASGEFVDVLVEDVKGVVGDSELFVVVDPDNDVAELREGNNSDWASGTPASTLGSLEVDTDAGSYHPSASVEISSTTTNTGSFAGDFQIALRVEDSVGDVVADLGEADLGTLEPGEAGNAETTWNTDAIVAGTYTIVATLYGSDGSVADEASTSVVLRATEVDEPAATLRTSPDAAVYGSHDTVDIEHLVRNVSPNAVLVGTELTTVVIDPDGMERDRSTVGVGDLPARAQRERLVHHVLDTAPAGTWTVQGILRDGDGVLLAEDQGHFDVEARSGDAVTGTVEAQHAVRIAGEPQTCTDRVENIGGRDVNGLQVRRLVLNRTDGALVSSASDTLDIAAGASDLSSRGVPTTGLNAGIYSCVLQIQDDAGWRALDSAEFEIEVPPVQLEGELSALDRGRLLVLLDPPNHHDGRCEGLSRVDVDARFKRTLGAGATLEVSVLDHRGRLIDSERKEASDSPPVNVSAGYGADLSVLAADGRSARLRLATAVQQPLDRHYSIEIRAWRDGRIVLSDRERVHTGCRDHGHGGKGDGNHGRDGWKSGKSWWSGGDRSHGKGHGTRSWFNWGGWHRNRFEAHVVDTRPWPEQGDGEPTEREWLETVLTREGWSYRIVTDAEAFTLALRSGGYEAYALLAERVKLPVLVQRELHAAVTRGAGLLAAGWHDGRNHFLFDTLGVHLRGRFHVAGGVRISESPLHAGSDQQHRLQASDKPLRVCVAEGDVAARYTGGKPGWRWSDNQPHRHARTHGNDRSANELAHALGESRNGYGWGHDRCGGHKHKHGNGWRHRGDRRDVAVSYRELLDGRTVFAGFDLLAEAHAEGTGRPFEALLLGALDWTHPSDPAESVDSVRGYRVTVDNLGIATPGRVLLDVPDAMQVVDPGEGTLTAEGSVEWPFDLAEGESVDRIAWLRLPDTPGTTQLDALIQSGSPGTFLDQVNVSLSIDVTARPTLDQARADACAAGWHYWKVCGLLKHADQKIERGRYRHALFKLALAEWWLRRHGLPPGPAIHAGVLHGIRRVERLWWSQAVEAGTP